jgi:hypothetical protein
MSNVPDNLRHLVVEGEGDPSTVRNELLLALVDAVEKMAQEQTDAIRELVAELGSTNRELARIGSSLKKQESE